MRTRKDDETLQPAPLVFVLTSAVSTIFLRGQLDFLADRGHRCVVICSPAPAHVEGSSSRAEMRFVRILREPAVGADLKAVIALVREFRSLRPAMVNFSTPKASLLAGLAAALCRVPLRVHQVRGYRFETMRGWRRTVALWSEKLASRLSHVVVLDSLSLLAVAQQNELFPPSKGVIIGGGSSNGVDIERFHPDDSARAEGRTLLSIPASALVIGFVGRLTRDKGVDDLVCAFLALREQVTELFLLLIGDYEEADPVGPQTAAFLASDRSVRRVSFTRLPEKLFPVMDVLCFPSYREGLPNVPLEAQAAGVPVVGYAATGTVDAVLDGTTGLLVPVGDAAGLTEGLRLLLTAPGERERLGAAARAWVARAFDQRTLWPAIADFYEARLGSRRLDRQR